MDPTRRTLLGGAAALAVAGCSSPGSERPPDRGGAATGDTGWTGATGHTGRPLPSRPHLIYVFCDQLRADALGVLGNPLGATPNLDRLASEAAVFSRCLTNGPSCRAARTTMMTGLHVFEHGVTDNHVRPDPRKGSHVARIRDEAGYFTKVVGKTHLHMGTGHLADHLDLLLPWGFVDAVELPDPNRWQARSAHSDWLTATTPKGEADKYERWQRYVQDYTWEAPPPDAAPWRLSVEDHLDSFCGRTAEETIRGYADDRPLYLQVNFPGPHKPFDPPSAFLQRFDPSDPRMPAPILVAPSPPVAPLVRDTLARKGEPWDEGSARRLRAHYHGKVALVDEAIGGVFRALREAGMWDDAWVVLHSDHGEMAADHLLTGKVVAYESSIRVPLLIKPPRGVVGFVTEALVDQRDVTATLLAAAGLDPAGMGDRDLGPSVVAGAGPSTKVVVFENLGMAGVRDDRSKLSFDLASGRPAELYLLDEDPEELRNRVLDPEVEGEVARLMDELRAQRPLPEAG